MPQIQPLRAHAVQEEYRSRDLQEIADRIGRLVPLQSGAREVFGKIPELKRIVVGTDGSPGAQRAIEWTGHVARWFGSTVTAVSIAPARSMFASFATERLEPDRSLLRAIEIDRRVERVLAALPASADLKGIKLNVEFDRGHPGRRLLWHARDRKADLLIVGSHGYSGSERAAPGSVADAVRHHAPCSVLIARNDFEKGPVLVGTDGSRASLHAIRVALRFGAMMGQPVIVLHAHDLPTFGPELPLDDGYEHALKQVADEFPVEIMNGRLRLHFTHAPAVKAILAAASQDHAALIVVGGRGRSALGHMLGSVSNKVSAIAETNVLIVR